METNTTFTYQYSAAKNKEVERIRSKYVKAEKTDLEALRELDSRVSRPANIFGYVYGSISAIVMGAGMSLVMTDVAEALGLGNGLVPGVIIGVIGLGLSLLTYPLYKTILRKRRKAYGQKIIELSEKIESK